MDEPQQNLDPFAPAGAPQVGPDRAESDRARNDGLGGGEPDTAEAALDGDASSAGDAPWSFDESEQESAGRLFDYRQADQAALPPDMLAEGGMVPRLDSLREPNSSWPPARRGPGLGQHLVAVIAGGILGLAIGYWLLNWLGGSRFDLLGVPLPGVPHTHDDAPRSEGPEDEARAIEVPTTPVPDEEIVPAAPEMRTVDHPPLADFDAPLSWPPPQESKPIESAQVPLPEGYVGPRYFVPYGFDDLTEALAAAGAAAACGHCRGTGFVTEITAIPSGVREEPHVLQQASRRVLCDQCQGHAAARMTAASYGRFCRLAEVATFVQVDAADGDIGETKDALRLLLSRCAAVQQNLNTIGRLAGRRLEATGDESDGILLAGTVHETAGDGDVYLLRIVLFGLPKVVTVASARRSILGPKDRVVILGTVVRRPRENLIGYDGRLPLIVWGGMPVRLPPAGR